MNYCPIFFPSDFYVPLYYFYKYIHIFYSLFLELPQNQPQITGGGDININYKPGDVLSLNCTSAPSNPPANLKWLLNDQPVSTNFAFLFLLFYISNYPSLSNVQTYAKLPYVVCSK